MEMNKKSSIIALIAMVFLLVVASSVWAVSDLVSYQGMLTDDNGTPLDGVYDMRFHLCDSLAGGTYNWTEEQSVSVTNGIYNVHLGSSTPFPAGLFDADTLYLEVNISDESTWVILSPRQELTSVAASFYAQYALNAGSVDGFDSTDFTRNDQNCPAGQKVTGFPS